MAGLKGKIAAELSVVKAQLPIGRDPASRGARRQLFGRFDPNGNGILSLAEIDLGLTKLLKLSADSLAKPAIQRAFHAARQAAPAVAEYSNNYVSRSEFRYLLVYLRYYLEIWKLFQRIDSNGDRRVRFSEFRAALPQLRNLGIREAAAWEANPEAAFQRADRDGGGIILFDEFADFCLRSGLLSLSGGEDAAERQEALEALSKRGGNFADASSMVSPAPKKRTGRYVDIDWAAVDAMLPTGKDEHSKAARRKLFSRFDPNGNGILSLAELDAGLLKVLNIGGMKDCRPAINRAFHAAREIAPPVADFSNDYIDRNEFRIVLLYLRRYLELWQLFNRADVSGDRKVDLAEFKNALSLLRRWGLREADDWQRNPTAGFRKLDMDGGGSVRFIEFADWCLKHCLKNLDDPAERAEARAVLQKKQPACRAAPGAARALPAGGTATGPFERSIPRDAGHLQHGCRESLRQLMRPEMQGAIEEWLGKVGEAEMRSINRLARLARPGMLGTVEKKRPRGLVPTMVSGGGLTVTGQGLSCSASMPALQADLGLTV